MKHIKLWEHWTYDYDRESEDEHLNSFDYFIETYINGQYSQLRYMLKRVKIDKELPNLNKYINMSEMLDDVSKDELIE